MSEFSLALIYTCAKAHRWEPNMKIQSQNVNIYMGKEYNPFANTKNEKKEQKSLFMGNTSTTEERVNQKREEARQKAAKLVREQFKRDKAVTDGIEESRERVEVLREESSAEMDLLGDMKEKKTAAENQLKSSVEQGASAEEQKELVNSVNEYNKIISEKEKEDGKRQKEIQGEIGSIKSRKQALLKNQGMIKTKELTGEIIENASEDIKGILLQEGVEHVKEEQENIQEKAEAKAEEKEQLEERVEELKEEKNKKSTSQKDSLTSEDIDKDALARMKEVIKEIKLADEELKGLMVDTLS